MRARLVHQGVEVSQPLRKCAGKRAVNLIPYFNVLSAKDLGDNRVSISYVNTTLVPAAMRKLIIRVESTAESGDSPDQLILSQAYRGQWRPLKLLVLVNPHGGQGNAHKLFNYYASAVFAAAGCNVSIIETERPGHAMEIAENISIGEHDAIICVSGDGLVHEVLNGFARRPDAAEALRKLPIGALAGGSGNAVCNSINGTDDMAICALNIVKSRPMPLDLMYITQGNMQFYSFLSQSYGIVAEGDLSTEEWRWMGSLRFVVGIVLRTLALSSYPCTISYKAVTETRKDLREYYEEHRNATEVEQDIDVGVKPRYGTVRDPIPEDWTIEEHVNLHMFYVGKMPYMSSDALAFPYALPTDGTMDMLLWDSNVGRVKSLLLLSRFSDGGHLKDDSMRYLKIAAYRLVPHSHTYLSIDGEHYPPEPFQVEIVPRAACVLSAYGYYHGNA